MSESTVHTLSIFQITYLKSLFDLEHHPAKINVLNCGICDGDMIVGYIKYGQYTTERIPRYFEEPPLTPTNNTIN